MKNGYGNSDSYYGVPNQPCPQKHSKQEIEFYFWVNCIMLPFMIESSSFGVDRNSRSVEVYSV